jgi:hypothetical protein
LIHSRFQFPLCHRSHRSQPPTPHACASRTLTFAGLTAAISLCALSPSASAQNSNYAEYPQRRGDVQPLEWKQLPPWLTLSMELRGRTEGNTSYNLTQDGDRIYELTRVFGSAEIRPSRFLTGYLQFIDTHAPGLPNRAQLANMRDVFDDRQAYFDLHFKAAKLPVRAIVGRQELKFGSERIIGISDWTNNSRTWDGVAVRLGDKTRVDLFSTSVVNTNPTSLDKHGAGLTFHGAYANIDKLLPQGHFQPYVLVRAVRDVTSQQGLRGNEIETTFGFEANGKLPAHFDYIVNASLQRGSYSNNSLHAGQSFGKLNYSLDRLPWRPRLGGEYDYATGNSHRNPQRIGTYDQQYPSNHNAFGLFDLFGYQNIRQERLNLDLGPTRNLTFLVQGEFLHLANAHDNLYSGPGSVLLRAPSAGFTSDQIGAGFDAAGKYVFRNYIVANFGVGHFFPGALMLANNKGSAQTYAFFSLTYRFRVDKDAAPRSTSVPGKTDAASSR